MCINYTGFKIKKIKKINTLTLLVLEYFRKEKKRKVKENIYSISWCTEDDPQRKGIEPWGVQERLSRRSLSQVKCRGKNLSGRERRT